MEPGFPLSDNPSPPHPPPFYMGLLQLPVDPPVPEGCLSLEAALQAGGVAQFILSSALPPSPFPPRDASLRAVLQTAVVAALLCIDVVRREGLGKSQEHKRGGA